MRNGSTKGFTLIELLIVIAIIGILAAVLIPNLLNARARAFDTAAQTCARSLASALEVQATNSPFAYMEEPTQADIAPSTACDSVNVDITLSDGDATNGYSEYTVVTRHTRGTTTYTIQPGTGVEPGGTDPTAALPAS